MKNAIRLLAIVIFISANTSAQTSVNHLLWRISGNGLSKPSYLFGTMHLTDKRLFFFGDSLYHALEQTEGFAAEIDFNAFLNKYFEKLAGEGRSLTYLKNRLDERSLKERSGKLEKKFKKPVDEITVEDIKQEESRRRTARLKSGEMETFMDAYLLGLADKQGKWIGGIEDPEDQLDLDDAFDTESRVDAVIDEPKSEKNQSEWMIQQYLKENLELIDRSNELWLGARDVILIRRNLKMATRVDSIMHLRSCLFAIGAAHLPGDSGVVQLLRRQGYDVTPVISSKKIDPKKYTYTEVKKEWVEVWAQDSLFSVKMPMQPSPMSIFGDLPFDMRFYYDLPSNIAYFTAYIPMLGVPKGSEDSIMASISRYYRKEGTAYTEKDITWKGNKGKEFMLESSDGQLRVQVFIPGGYVAMQLVAALKKEALYSENAVRYLTSFKPDTARAAAHIARTQAMGLQKIDYPADAFSIQAPVRMRRRKVDIGDNGWKRIMIDGASPKTGAYYMITVDANTPGYYSDKDSLYFKENEKAMAERVNGKVISSRQTSFEGYPAYELIIRTSKFEKELMMRMFFVNRGNNRYILYKTSDPKTDSSAVDDPFFSSLKFLPYQTNRWQNRNAANEFSTYAPAAFTVDTSENGIISFNTYDSASALTYTTNREVLPKYYWFANEDSLFEKRLDTYVGEGDSVLEKKKFRTGKTTGLDILIRLKQSRSVKRMRVLLNGDTLYTSYCFILPELLAIPVYKKYFDEFRVMYEAGETTAFINKTKALLKDLQSEDSTTFAEAKWWVGNANFTADDLPPLQQAVLYNYQDYEDGDMISSSAGSSIAERIVALDTAGTSVGFIRKNYPSLTGNKAHIRFVLLDILAEQRTSASYDLLKQLLGEPLPEVEDYVAIGFYDSLSLSKKLFPEAFRAIENTTMKWQVGHLASMLLDSGYLDIAMIKDHKQLLVDQVSELLSLSPEKLENSSYRYLPMITILGRLKDQEANVLIRKLAKMSELQVAEAALMALLDNGENVTVSDLLPLAKSDEYRATLYDKLSGENKLDLFPKEFLTQRLLGQSYVFSAAYEEGAPAVTYLKEKTVEFNGKKQKFYLYKVTFGDGEDEEETNYLGVAGPFSLNIKEMKTDESGTGINWHDEFDAKKIDALFDAWFKRLTEEGSEEGPEEE